MGVSWLRFAYELRSRHSHGHVMAMVTSWSRSRYGHGHVMVTVTHNLNASNINLQLTITPTAATIMYNQFVASPPLSPSIPFDHSLSLCTLSQHLQLSGRSCCRETQFLPACSRILISSPRKQRDEPQPIASNLRGHVVYFTRLQPCLQQHSPAQSIVAITLTPTCLHLQSLKQACRHVCCKTQYHGLHHNRKPTNTRRALSAQE
jgi:hypothetical protein